MQLSSFVGILRRIVNARQPEALRQQRRLETVLPNQRAAQDRQNVNLHGLPLKRHKGGTEKLY